MDPYSYYSVPPPPPPTMSVGDLIVLSVKICVLGFLVYILIASIINAHNEFKVNNTSITTSDINHDTNKTISELTKVDINCSDKTGLNKIKYIDLDGTPNKFKYEYSCTDDTYLNKDTIYEKETNSTSYGINNLAGSINMLDLQNITCDSNQILNKFKLEKNSTNSTINYKYNCIQSTRPLICRRAETSMFQSDDGLKLNNLKKISPSCNEDEALQSLKFNKIGNFIGYDFTCCKY
jgi:hypothetical protein